MATSNVIAHKNLTDPQLHEPKGIAAANEGSVYFADGNGSGEWKVPEFSDIEYTAPYTYNVPSLHPVQSIWNVNYNVMSPVTDGTVADAGDWAQCNKNVKQVGEQCEQLRVNMLNAFVDIATLRNYLNTLIDNLKSSGIISGS